MRILVFSDSHGDYISIKLALSLHPQCEAVLFLGDGENDFRNSGVQGLISGKITYEVAGNCDYGSYLTQERLVRMSGKLIYLLHGHTKAVKRGNDEIIKAANENAADIVVYGHTHNAAVDYIDGIHIMCPGSIRNGSYGIIDITDSGIVCFTCNLNKKLTGSF